MEKMSDPISRIDVSTACFCQPEICSNFTSSVVTTMCLRSDYFQANKNTRSGLIKGQRRLQNFPPAAKMSLFVGWLTCLAAIMLS